MWKLPQPRKSIKDAFGDIFLMISSATWKTLLGFPQLLTSPAAAIYFKPLTKGWAPFARSGRAPFPLSKAYLARLEKKHGKAKALTALAHKLGRAVYHMLRRKEAFDMKRFLNR